MELSLAQSPTASRPLEEAFSPTAGQLPPLPRDFYERDPALVARELVGALLVRELDGLLVGGRIVETEAYLSRRDPACHASRGKTRKNQTMFGPPGCAYVYMIHARWCLNAVTEPEGAASAVLIRAVVPLFGVETMLRNRPVTKLRDLCRGPARLCQALAVSRSEDGADLTVGNGLWIAAGQALPERAEDDALRVLRSRRIGIHAAAERLLRFYARENPYVSGSSRLNRSGRS